jgi:hypothetical protein
MHGIAPDPNWNPRGKRALELVFPVTDGVPAPEPVQGEDSSIRAVAVSHSVEETGDDALPPARLGRPAVLRALGLAAALAVLFGAVTLLEDPQAREAAWSWATMGHTTEVANTAHRIETTIQSIFDR